MGFDFSLVTAHFRMQPELRPVASGAPQLTPSLPGARHLCEKFAVLSSFARQSLLSSTGFDAFPALRAIAAEAALASPAAFVFTGATSTANDPAGDCDAPLLRWSLRHGEPAGDGDPAIGALLRSLPRPQRCAALLSLAYEEDFAIVDAATGTVPWLAVCLPSRWAPEAKIGLRLAEVHGPVADAATLRSASESLLALVTGSRRWERSVWTISADPRLDQHPARRGRCWPPDVGPAPADCNAATRSSVEAGADDRADALAALASFRSERQTFIPVPGTRQAVFTIRVESLPLLEAVTSSDTASRLHAALASMSSEVLAYRDLAGAHERLLNWLARQAVAAPPAKP